MTDKIEIQMIQKTLISSHIGIFDKTRTLEHKQSDRQIKTSMHAHIPSKNEASGHQAYFCKTPYHVKF